MKKGLFGFALLGFMLISMSFVYTTFKSFPSENTDAEINWLTFEEAVKAQEKQPRKIVIDMYTDWCGWCKVMDRETFSDPEIIEYVNKHFYAVKFNAEQKEPITFQGKTYNFVNTGRRGIHTLAYSLMQGKASYPSFVFLDEKFNNLGVSKGFKKPDAFISDLKQVAEYKGSSSSY